MAQLYNYLTLPLPYLAPDPNPLVDPPDVIQLKLDTANVVEGRVPISNFPPEYQEKIKSFYRFSATRYVEEQPVIAKRTTDTLDII